MIAEPVLVLVDMQNDFCKPGFAHDAKEGVDVTDSNIQSAIDNAGAFLERSRESGRTPILVVTKHRYNAFFETDLDTILRASGISKLLIGGVATHVCVESTVRGAYDRNYGVTTLADCSGATDAEQHDRVLQNVALHFGNVASSEEVELAPVRSRAHSA